MLELASYRPNHERLGKIGNWIGHVALRLVDSTLGPLMMLSGDKFLSFPYEEPSMDSLKKYSFRTGAPYNPETNGNYPPSAADIAALSLEREIIDDLNFGTD